MSTPRPGCAVVGALLIALCVAACGSTSTTTSNANAGTGANQPGGARRGFLQDPKVVACLKKQGVTVPSRPRSGGGGTPGGQDGQPSNGQPPSGQGRPNRDPAQMQKLRAALQKCGVDFGGDPPNGQPPQGQGTTSTSAS